MRNIPIYRRSKQDKADSSDMYTVHIFRRGCPQMTGLGIGMRIMRQHCTCDSVFMSRTSCDSVCVTLQALLHTLQYIVCLCVGD